MEYKILDISRVADNAITIGQIIKITSTGVDVATAQSDALTRAELEDSARAAGVADDAIAGAANKAAPIDLINAPKTAPAAQEQQDPSANL